MNTPKWALSDEWKEELHRREEEMVRVEGKVFIYTEKYCLYKSGKQFFSGI